MAPGRRSLLPFDRGGEVRLYDESLHIHDVALALLGEEGTKDFHTRPRRLPRIPNSKFRIHAQRVYNSVNELDRTGLEASVRNSYKDWTIVFVSC